MERGFLDILIGDVVVVCDEYSHDYEEHYFKVTSIEYEEEFINEDNPEGMRCYGEDLDCDTDDYIGVVTEGNFINIV